MRAADTPRDERLTNLEFVRGEVANLPFADAAFTLVFARFALHHLTDPCPALGPRWCACVVSRGRVVVMDLAASTDPRVAERQDRIERLRDPSHVRMPPRGSVRRWLQEHGLIVDVVAEREIERPLVPWLEQAVTDAVGGCSGVRGLRNRAGRWHALRDAPAPRVLTVRCGSANCGRSPRRTTPEARLRDLGPAAVSAVVTTRIGVVITKGVAILNADFAPVFPLHHAAKDAELALSAAHEHGVSVTPTERATPA